MENQVVFVPAVDDPVSGHSVDHGQIENYNPETGEMVIKVILPSRNLMKRIQRNPSQCRAYEAPTVH